MTQLVAHAAFPKGNLYLRLRDELGTLYTDQDFAGLYPTHGQPTLPPWRLALVTVMQFLENLSDRQTAEAVRGRIDWKYALGLELTDAGFDFSVLSEFRSRLLSGQAEQMLLDRMLDHFAQKGLVKARGKQRTDSTHVLAAIRLLNRLELVTETLRATLNDLAEATPEWLRSVVPADWYSRYGRRVEQSRLPKGEEQQKRFAEQVGQDGFLLLTALTNPEAPEGLEESTAVQTLREVWERHFEITPEGKAAWRAGPQLSRAANAIESPYDVEARHSTKRDTVWTGYKVHVSETCDDDTLHVITNVHTTVATTQDVSSTADIHQSLKEKNLLPGEHLVDAGYVDAELLVESKEQHDLVLFGPTRLNPSWQKRQGGYALDQFVVDWDKERVLCPQGKQSSYWRAGIAKPYNHPVIKVRFAQEDCSACPSRSQCVRSEAGRSRQMLLRSQAHQQALTQVRARMATEIGAREYQRRAGVEGTLSQGIRRCGLRQSRYVGRDKTHLQHVAIAAAINLVRMDDYLMQRPIARTRVSRFAKLAA